MHPLLQVLKWRSLIKDQKTLPCAAYLNGEYGYKDIYAGVPVTIGKKGVEKILEIKLENNEKSNFDVSINAVLCDEKCSKN